jgi:hypothetical protein
MWYSLGGFFFPGLDLPGRTIFRVGLHLLVKDSQGPLDHPFNEHAN